jgi:hypothetical protein
MTVSTTDIRAWTLFEKASGEHLALILAIFLLAGLLSSAV